MQGGDSEGLKAAARPAESRLASGAGHALPAVILSIFFPRARYQKYARSLWNGHTEEPGEKKETRRSTRAFGELLGSAGQLIGGKAAGELLRVKKKKQGVKPRLIRFVKGKLATVEVPARPCRSAVIRRKVVRVIDIVLLRRNSRLAGGLCESTAASLFYPRYLCCDTRTPSTYWMPVSAMVNW